MKKIVMKFGGTSLATGKKIRRVAKIVANHIAQGSSVVVVVSALDGVTDKLIEAAEQAKKGNKDYICRFKEELSQRHLAAAKTSVKNKHVRASVEQILEVTIDELEKVLTGIIYVRELTLKSRDTVLSFGERLSAPIICGTLKDLKFDAQFLTGGEAGIVTDSNFGEANPLMNLTKHQVKGKVEALLEKGTILVVTGYIAASQDGVITTLGRGGSDYTATILGATLSAEVWIWTDVDGLMTADPKIVSSAKMLPQLSFQEASEMTFFGAKAMHPKALEPAMQDNVPVRIRGISDPENPGTLIVKSPRTKASAIVKAVNLVRDVALINVSGAGMVGAPGTAAKVFEVLGNSKINILMISQSVSEANISFVIRRGYLERAVSLLEIALLGKGLIRSVTAEDDVCVVAIVGAGMKGTPGVASRLFSAVADRSINVRMIAQGSSELNISFVIKEYDAEEAVRAVHREFKLDKIR